MQYSFQKYHTTITSDNSQYSNDFYQTTELLLGTNIRNHWQLLLFLPHNNYYTSSDDGVSKNNGLGDVTFMGNYNILNEKKLNKDTVTIFQQLAIGIGVKLPTGKYSIDVNELVTSANMQAGSGSYDLLLNMLYIFQIENRGYNFNANYRINQSAGHFKFGNRLKISCFAFRSFQWKKISLNPNIGMLFENLKENTMHSEVIKDTGGNVLLTAPGLELQIKHSVMGMNIQFPLFSNLSHGQTTPMMRGMCHLSFMF